MSKRKRQRRRRLGDDDYQEYLYHLDHVETGVCEHRGMYVDHCYCGRLRSCHRCGAGDEPTVCPICRLNYSTMQFDEPEVVAARDSWEGVLDDAELVEVGVLSP